MGMLVRHPVWNINESKIETFVILLYVFLSKFLIACGSNKVSFSIRTDLGVLP